MNVGRFKETLVIEKPDFDSETVDAYGRRVVPWYRFGIVMASAQDVSGKEYFEAAAHQLQHTVTFTFRWLDGVDASMRILWRGECWQIDQINHLGYRRDFMRAKAHRIEPEGVNHYGEL